MGARIDIGFLEMFRDDWFLLSDFTDFFLGNFIGGGTSRSVYEFRQNKKLVVKIDRSRYFNNVIEWELYNEFKSDPKIAPFLAKCEMISSCGRILLQEKTEPVAINKMPNKIPDIFSDIKIQNWGSVGKRIVCHDYANNTLFTSKRVKMIKPDWWSDRYQVL